MRYGAPFSIAALGALLATPALAAVEISSVAINADGKTSQHIVSLTSDRAKVDTERTEIIVRDDTGKLVMLSKEKREYTEVDSKELNARMSQVQQLQALPEAQRKQVEAMMAQRGMAGAISAPEAQPVYEKAGQTKTIGIWTCQLFHQKKDGQLTADLCIAPVASVGLTKEDVAAYRKFAEAMRKSVPPGARRNAALFDFDAQTKQIGFEGLPVETVIYQDGKPSITTTVKSIDHVPLAADAFEVPAGYTKRDMPAAEGKSGGQ